VQYGGVVLLDRLAASQQMPWCMSSKQGRL